MQGPSDLNLDILMKSNINSIYQELKKHINPSRLKEISVDIISKYKAKDRGGLSFYAVLLGIDPSGISINRLFANIIQNYHPDKLTKIHNEIELYYRENKIEELLRIKNIFVFDEPVQSIPYLQDVEVEEAYTYRDEDFGYYEKTVYDDDTFTEDEFIDPDELFEDREFGFIEVVNRFFFGNLDYTLNISDLQDLDGELDLSDYDIIDLRGIEYCININSLNLSGNNLRKIERISSLTRLESLYLSGNSIQNIDCLSTLTNLKELDVSFNEIEDISVLDKLENLLYVNLLGNQIKDTGIIKELTEKGVLVIF